MTGTTLDTGAALWAAVLRDPDCDTLRLAYADYLDENGDPDRAEFISVQVASALLRSPDPTDLDARACEILDANPAWSQLKCRMCLGGGYVPTDRDDNTCEVCGGTGDLFRDYSGGMGALGPAEAPRTLTFRAGYPDSVSCTLAELGAEQDVKCDHRCAGYEWSRITNVPCPDCRHNRPGTVRRFVPSPWAVAVVRAVPVTAFVVTEKVPEPHTHEGQTNYSWYEIGLAEDRATIPPGVFGHLPQSALWQFTGDGRTAYETGQAATDALARALGSLVRAAVYGAA